MTFLNSSFSSTLKTFNSYWRSISHTNIITIMIEQFKIIIQSKGEYSAFS
jgi:hypothetical protein